MDLEQCGNPNTSFDRMGHLIFSLCSFVAGLGNTRYAYLFSTYMPNFPTPNVYPRLASGQFCAESLTHSNSNINSNNNDNDNDNDNDNNNNDNNNNQWLRQDM